MTFGAWPRRSLECPKWSEPGSAPVRPAHESRGCRVRAEPDRDASGSAMRRGLRRDAVARLPAIAAAAGAAAAAAVAAPAAWTATTARARLVLRLVDAQCPAAHLMTVEVLDGACSVCLTHLHEAEATWPPGLTVGRQRDRLDRAVLGKQRAHIRLSGGEREIPDVNLGHAMILWMQSTQTDSAGS
jgi:hypothetical protein